MTWKLSHIKLFKVNSFSSVIFHSLIKEEYKYIQIDQVFKTAAVFSFFHRTLMSEVASHFHLQLVIPYRYENFIFSTKLV